jgi:hypothetical protein
MTVNDIIYYLTPQRTARMSKADRRQGQGTETPGGTANACPQQRDRHRRDSAGEPGAKEAEETRRCLTFDQMEKIKAAT